jgi:hypothetical protein
MARGRGFGRGFWSGFGPGRGMGMGNPYPFCRNFPWLPRRWWTGMYNGSSSGNVPCAILRLSVFLREVDKIR